MNKKEIVKNITLDGVIEICDTHADRLRIALSKIASWMPATHQKLKDMTPEQLGYLELFSSRFAKLQDLMGNKLFPLTLVLTKDSGHYPAFIDVVNQLEKIEALPSAHQWFKLKDIRNAFTHDYPDDSEVRAKALNTAYEHAYELLNIYEGMLKFINRYRNL